MTIIYKVQVELRGTTERQAIMTAADSPMAACEAAERIVAHKMVGDLWPQFIHQFFACHVRETTGADFIHKSIDAATYRGATIKEQSQ